MNLNHRRGLCYSLPVFAVSLLYFVCTYHFYDPVKLELSGTASAEANLQLAFDSGNGFTSFERLPLKVARTSPEFAEFKLLVDLPQTKIIALRVDGTPEELAKVQIVSVGASTPTRQLAIPIQGSALEAKGIELGNGRLHLGLLTLQIILSAFLAWLVWLLVTQTIPDERFSWKRIGRVIFLEEGRYFFWIIFVAASVVYTLWLLAYWPGATTNDSWSSLHDVRAVSFTDWHPYVYGIYLLSLMQFFGSIAAVAMFQILATAAVGAWIFYYVWREGVRWYWLAPFILLFIFSIPIGLFNIILWKDVPFSIAVWLLSFLLYRVQLKRETSRELVNIPSWCFPLLGIFFILLLHSRHNGKIFYLFLPLLFWRRISGRHFVSLLVFLTLSFATLNIAIPNMFNMGKITGSAYHELRTALGIMTHYNFYSKDRKKDFEIVEKFTGEKWERIVSLYPQNWFTISDFRGVVMKQNSPDGSPERGEFTKRFLLRLIMENLPIFLTLRFFDFFHSIGLDSSEYSASTNYFEDPLQLQSNNLAPPGALLYGASVASWRPFPALSEVVSKIDGWSRQYDGLTSPSVLIWNLALFYSLFILIIFFEKGTSSIGLYTVPTFIVSAGIFIIGAGESWRYFYYAYLVGIFLVPLYLAYRIQLAKRAL